MSMQYPARAFGLPLEQSRNQQVQPEKKKKSSFLMTNETQRNTKQYIYSKDPFSDKMSKKKENITLILPFLPS